MPNCGILSVSVADFCSRLIEGLSFQRTKLRRVNPPTRPQGLDSSTDLESRSTTSFLGRAWLTEKETRKVDFEDVRTITITMACWQRGVKPGHAV